MSIKEGSDCGKLTCYKLHSFVFVLLHYRTCFYFFRKKYILRAFDFVTCNLVISLLLSSLSMK